MDAIGGYPSFFWSNGPSSAIHPQAYRYQAARYALLALLSEIKPATIHVPWFICDVIVRALQTSGLRVNRYHLDTQMLPQARLMLSSDEVLLYVNYFGCADQQVSTVLNRFDPQQVILDFSQALFAPAPDCLATIYSPRKFLPLPDGGLLHTARKISSPADQDCDSENRSKHLWLRAALGAEAGYDAFLVAEQSLEAQLPKQMSNLTGQLMSRLNCEEIAHQRRANYAYLEKHLGPSNHFNRPKSPISPLSYPYFGSPEKRDLLTQKRIYTPTYWPEAEASCLNGVEKNWKTNLVHLPVDQRLTQVSLKILVEAIK